MGLAIIGCNNLARDGIKVQATVHSGSTSGVKDWTS
jgi:hypothetical protein